MLLTSDRTLWKNYPCILLTSNMSNGYVYLNMPKGQELAHRQAFYKHYGHMPKWYVCHHCDTRNCIQPHYLFDGTPDDNMQDASRKKRLNNKNSSYHLSNGIKNRIVDLIKADLNRKSIAKHLNISERSIYNTLRRYKGRGYGSINV